jgi:hypothetical protein
MVSDKTNPKGIAAGKRLNRLMAECGVPTKADLARWIKARNAQRVGQWWRRGIPLEGAQALRDVSGASVEWLTEGREPAFPRGAKRYPPPSAADLDPRVAQLEDNLDVSQAVLSVMLRIFSERLPGAAAELVLALRDIPDRGDPERLAALVDAVEQVHEAEASAGRPAGHRGSGRKPGRGDL